MKDKNDDGLEEEILVPEGRKRQAVVRVPTKRAINVY
jgi:hypothetical protein